jgi:hypothetical protein
MPWTISRREEIDAYLLSRSFGIYALMAFVAGEGFWYKRIKRTKVEYVVSVPCPPRPPLAVVGFPVSTLCCPHECALDRPSSLSACFMWQS